MLEEGELLDSRFWIRCPVLSEDCIRSLTRIEKDHAQPTVWVFCVPRRNIFNEKTYFVISTPNKWCHLQYLLQGTTTLPL